MLKNVKHRAASTMGEHLYISHHLSQEPYAGRELRMNMEQWWGSMEKHSGCQLITNRTWWHHHPPPWSLGSGNRVLNAQGAAAGSDRLEGWYDFPCAGNRLKQKTGINMNTIQRTSIYCLFLELFKSQVKSYPLYTIAQLHALQVA